MRRLQGVIVVLTIASWGAARADVEFKFGGQIASDMRYRLNGEEIPPTGVQAPFPTQQRLLKYGFSRNENLIKAQLSLTIADRVKAVADVDFYWYGYSDVHDINSETLHEVVDPYRLEANAAYVDIYKILPHLDLRIGRQVVVWGTADKFNPTNNINTLDLSDPLLFGKALANNMIRVDWNPFSDIVVTAVWVPIFRPAQLPRTAPLAVTQNFRPAPVQERGMQDWLGFDGYLHPPDLIRVNGLLPEPSIDNSQVGVRIAGRFGGVDMSVSYYHGRFGIPTPAWAIQQQPTFNCGLQPCTIPQPLTPPVTVGCSGGNCKITQPSIVDALVMWPRMDVLGADIAGSIEALKGLGYWVEAGLYFPQLINYTTINNLTGTNLLVSFRPNGGDPTTKVGYDQLQGGRPGQLPTVVPSTPFVKVTAGFDYSWNKYLYTNVQYVYGFIDEFGAGQASYARPGAVIGDTPRREARIGHYLVVGSDLKLANDAVLIRLFGAFKVPQLGDEDPKFTAVIFPQIAWAVWDATELSLGAFVFLGDRDTKFGDPAAGASEIFLKARFTY